MRPPAGGERDRFILAQLNSPLSEPLHFGNLVRGDTPSRIRCNTPRRTEALLSDFLGQR